MKYTNILLLLFFIIFLPKNFYAQEEFHLCAKSKIQSGYNQNSLAKINYPGDQTIDVTYYKLNIDINPESKFLSGIVTVKGSFNKSLNNEFYLDLQNVFSVTSVKSTNNDISFSHNNNQVIITLEKVYEKDEEFSVDIYYSGHPGSSGFGSFAFSAHADEHAIWSLSEPFGASDWFPVKDTPDDKADSADIWITVPAGLTAVSNGILVDKSTAGSKTTFKWKTQYPIAQYLLSVAITNYSIYKDYFKYSETDSMEVVHYIYPENLTPERKLQLNRTTNMLEVFTELFGEYPFIKEKYGHAEFGWGGGMEHQTISSMGSFGTDITSHELAHQWFGDKITCKNWENIWLNEGFATYSEMLYREVSDGKNYYDWLVTNEMNSARHALGSIYVENLTVSEIFNGNRSYAKGGIVLHMLRGIVGDDNFFTIIKNYANDPELEYNVAVTEDFKAHAETVYGKTLDYFFDEWIYGENYPKYSYDWRAAELGNNNYEVNIDISQNSNSNPLFFTMPVELKIERNIGDTTVTVFNNEQMQSFTFNVKGKPSNLVFDPRNYILKDILSATDINDEAVISNYKLAQNYPNPFNPTTTIEYSLPIVKASVELKIFDMLGREIETLVNGIQNPGNYEVVWNASKFSSGIYFYSLKTDNFHAVKKMILLR
ncbi:MAG: T9SS type A sorting domain-containing protein [Melioribacteraceae bacterium]|nr:T9SS type A sorting domain-containing protein [Melioribacteraceae bacterium]